MSSPNNPISGVSNLDPITLSAEEVIAQLRTMRSQIQDVAPLSKEQRRQVKQRLREQPKVVVDAAINVIGVLDNVSQAIGNRSTKSVSCRTTRSAGTPRKTRRARS